MALVAAWTKGGRLWAARIARGPISFTWRIALAYGILLLTVGLAMGWIVDASMSRSVRAQIDRRLALAAGELGDIAAGYMSLRQPLDLRPLAERYSRYDGVAYVFIEDRKGNVLAYSMKSFPSDLQESRAAELRQMKRVTRSYHGRAVEEIQMPMEGQLGTAHIGVWRDAIEAEVKKSVRPVLVLIAVATCAAAALAVVLAHGLMYPLRRLTSRAGKLSTGDLETPVPVDSNDEIGELARSLERMRASLKAAIRLGRAH
jgi:HAMP domain-containing protein